MNGKPDIFLKVHGVEQVNAENALIDLEVLVVSEKEVLPYQDIVVSMNDKNHQFATGANGRTRIQLIFPFDSTSRQKLQAAMLGENNVVTVCELSTPDYIGQNNPNSSQEFKEKNIRHIVLDDIGSDDRFYVEWLVNKGDEIKKGVVVANLLCAGGIQIKSDDGQVTKIIYSQVSALVNGIIGKILIKDGVVVRKGVKIAEIWSSEPKKPIQSIMLENIGESKCECQYCKKYNRRMLTWHVDVGDYVKEGEIIYTIANDHGLQLLQFKSKQSGIINKIIMEGLSYGMFDQFIGRVMYKFQPD